MYELVAMYNFLKNYIPRYKYGMGPDHHQHTGDGKIKTRTWSQFFRRLMQHLQD